jgi:hypothetical protein
MRVRYGPFDGDQAHFRNLLQVVPTDSGIHKY